MSEHRYTIQEIDALRQRVKNKYLYGKYAGLECLGWSRSYSQSELDKHVEDRVRTLMLVGLTAKDLTDEP